jgi:signal transduction histidine kinase
MNIFAISNIIIFFTNSIITILVFWKGKKHRAAKVLGYFCLMVSLWGLGGYIFSTATIKEQAYLGWQIGYICCILSSPLYYHFVYLLLNLKAKFYKYILTSAYILSAIFLTLVIFAKKLFLGDLKFVFNQFYWTSWGPLWLVYHISFNWILLTFAFLLLLKAYIPSKGIFRNQLRYFILGSIMGWVGAHGDYQINFSKYVYPYWNFLIAIYPALWAYAIIKYRLIDIKIAITRTGIFLTLYAFILGLPFYIGYQVKNWFLSTALAVVLATIGPLIYRFLQKRAEELLLARQRRYQQLLVKASKLIVKEYCLERLLKWIVYVVKWVVGIQYAAVFLYDKENNIFRLQIQKGKCEIPTDFAFSYNHPFISYMLKQKEPFFYEELPSYIRESLNIPFEINIIIPSFIENRQLGFLILGEKLNRQFYTADDIHAFKILAHQAGLAIENALLYRKLEIETRLLKQTIKQLNETQDQLIQTEKLHAVGQLASGVAHEVRNPLEIIIQGINLLEEELVPNKDHIVKTLALLKDSVKRADKIIGLLVDFSKAGKLDLKLEDINSILDNSLNLVNAKFKFKNINVIKETKKGIPKVLIDKNKIEQVFVNAFLNAIQAMPEGGKLTIRVRIYEKALEAMGNGIGRRGNDYFRVGEKAVIVEVEDTGVGIPADKLKRIFDPFYTTKGPSGGTGLGLYVSRNIINMHKGLMYIESQEGKGTKVSVILKTAH